MDNRPQIPAEIRRKILVEAGHRCAIPTCRHIDVDVHHIVPWSDSKSHDYDNLIALCPNCHRRTHKGEIDRKSLRLYKINLRFAHDKYSQLEMDIILELSKAPSGAGIPWLPVMLILLKRALESRLLEVKSAAPQGVEISMQTMGIDMAPRLIVLSLKGREFVKELGLHEM